MGNATQPDTWSVPELKLVALAVESRLPLDELFDSLPARSVHSIRRKFCECHGADSDERRERAAEIGSFALARACRLSGGRFL